MYNSDISGMSNSKINIWNLSASSALLPLLRSISHLFAGFNKLFCRASINCAVFHPKMKKSLEPKKLLKLSSSE
jgi:hypothetical protein